MKDNPNTVYPVGSGSVNDLLGNLLTIVDASFGDPVQRKAVKDLVSQKVWQWYNDNRPMNHYEITYTRNDGERYVGYTTLPPEGIVSSSTSGKINTKDK